MKRAITWPGLVALLSLTLVPSAIQASDCTQVAELKSSDLAFLDRFGASVAIDGDTAVVGASGVDHSGIKDAGAGLRVRVERHDMEPKINVRIARDNEDRSSFKSL